MGKIMVDNYSAVLAWSDEDKAYVATCPEFPGLSGVAATAEAALRALQEARVMAIETLVEEHQALPPPKLLVSHSGQVRLRMPKSLHAELVAAAEREGVSFNTLAVMLLSLGVGRRQPPADNDAGALRRWIKPATTPGGRRRGGHTKRRRG